MVKSTGVTQPTDKVRLGRLTECDQPHNSIVLNASDTKIDNIEYSGFYVSPIRCTQASNLLAYNSITKEIVDVGGQKLKISSLEVENLDVVNSNTVHNYYIDNPIFEIAKGNPRNADDIGIVMHRAKGDVEIKFLEKQNHLSINKDLNVDGIVKAKIFEGDAGLLSNVQFNFEIGDTFENLNITKELRADGGLLSNISIQQLKDLKNASLDLDNIYAEGTLRVKKTIYSQAGVIAPSFVGDGRKLEGVALKEDVLTNTKQIEELKQTVGIIGKLEDEIKRVETIIPSLEPLKHTIQEVSSTIPNIKPLGDRLEVLEKYVTNIREKIQIIEKNVKDNKPQEINLTPIERGIVELKVVIDKIDIEKQSIIADIKRLQTTIQALPKVPDLTQRVIDVNSRIDDVYEALEKSSQNTKTEFSKHVNFHSRELSGRIENVVNSVQQIEQKIPLFETLISNVHDVEDCVTVLNENVPKIDERVQLLEDYVPPPITLQSVTSLESNTICSVTFENTGVSLSTFGNIGVGTNKPSSRVTIYNEPNIISKLGEVDAIKINELAQINAYTKANAGVSSGRPGGIVFKTKRPNGPLEDSMTIDGNGSVTVGNSTADVCAALSINSTERGLLLPRMTTNQINAIKKPQPGLMVYDIDKDTFVGYKKSGWVELC